MERGPGALGDTSDKDSLRATKGRGLCPDYRVDPLGGFGKALRPKIIFGAAFVVREVVVPCAHLLAAIDGDRHIRCLQAHDLQSWVRRVASLEETIWNFRVFPGVGVESVQVDEGVGVGPGLS